MFGRILNTLIYLQVLLVDTYLLQACSDIFKHYSRAYSRLSEFSVSLAYSKPWHIPITKHIQTLRYIHNTTLNIFTKAQSRTFDTNLNGPFFYRCYLTSRVTLHIFKLYLRIIQAYSRLIQPYLVLLKHVKSPGIFGAFSFSHNQAYSKRYTQYLGRVGHIHIY